MLELDRGLRSCLGAFEDARNRYIVEKYVTYQGQSISYVSRDRRNESLLFLITFTEITPFRAQINACRLVRFSESYHRRFPSIESIDP